MFEFKYVREEQKQYKGEHEIDYLFINKKIMFYLQFPGCLFYCGFWSDTFEAILNNE